MIYWKEASELESLLRGDVVTGRLIQGFWLRIDGSRDSKGIPLLSKLVSASS